MKYQIPNSFPDLSAAKSIAVDIETHDDDLTTRGPGVRRDGYIVGVAIVTQDKKFKAYYPMAHDEGPNLNPSAVLEWLSDELSREDQPKVGANLLYDMDYLTAAGVTVRGNWLDVQNAEPLIDENAKRYALDALAQKYLGKGKLTDTLAEECKKRGIKGKPASNIWRLPASVIGPYAIEDAVLSLDIFKKQKKILRADGLTDVFKIETYLMPLLLQMRQVGVRLDVEKLEKAITSFKRRLRTREKKLNEFAGFNVQYWAAASIAILFKRLKLKYPLTEKTKQPSFTQDFFERHEHEAAALILECRKMHKLINTFLEGTMRSQLVGDRIHCQFNQLRSDSFGTVTGRFSSSNPNLQQIPIRDPKLGPICRSMFVPERGHTWCKADYSQIEFRIFAHYALGQGSEDFRDRYTNDPEIDYHAWCAEIGGIDRRTAKDINFGLLYGMGKKLLAKQLKLTVEQAEPFLKEYNSKLPFIRTTSRKAMDVANKRGYVRTILGRRRRFDRWEPSDRKLAQTISPMRDKAELQDKVAAAIQVDPSLNGGVQRAKTYRALNAIVQGSSADMIKVAMVQGYRAGLFEVLVPHLTVHDELDFSVPKGRAGKRALKEMLEIMTEAIPLKVPVIVDCELGSNWGEVK